ncbi:hypothetical protein H5410_049496 [Solanum commersonii]|uniref:Uncharacterized protein n=1 Tax=Solanum commersonii TaxID=4109 RepID=A0A9J5WUC0_SOLCO|nr:hypothetical protein H5410_049496 [Solanum commersonii]
MNFLLWASVKTLVMDSIGPERQTSPFSSFVKTLVMESISPKGKMGPFSSSNEPRAGQPPFCQFSCDTFHGFLYPWIFGDPEFLRVFGRCFSWTSVKTLLIESVGPKGQTGLFSGSNDPRASKPPFYRFSCAIIHEFLVIRDSGVFLAKNFHGLPLKP